MHADLRALQGALSGQEPGWAALEVRGDRARVTPVLPPAVLYHHLNELIGENWDLDWDAQHTTPPIVRCRLTIQSRHRDGLGTAHDLDAARAVALTDAARAWGVLPVHIDGETTWVEYDPDEGPNTAELNTDLPPTEVHATTTLPPEPPRDPQLEKARRHIDELVDRLREEGLGKEAGRILLKQGYGNTIDESRRVYAELKTLLKA